MKSIINKTLLNLAAKKCSEHALGKSPDVLTDGLIKAAFKAGAEWAEKSLGSAISASVRMGSGAVGGYVPGTELNTAPPDGGSGVPERRFPVISFGAGAGMETWGDVFDLDMPGCGFNPIH